MKTSIIGYPRLGAQRELKFATEKYFRGKLTEGELLQSAANLRKIHWQTQKDSGLDFIPSNDFSFYDLLLDTAALFNIIPQQYSDLGLSDLETYFAMARGYQGKAGDVKALAMKKWFNTNYHYLVPEIDDNVEIKLVGTKPLDEYKEAKNLGIETKPVVIGPYTLLKLTRFTENKKSADVVKDLLTAYQTFIDKLDSLGVSWIQLDEPALIFDLTDEDKNFFFEIYKSLLTKKTNLKVLIQTYFGDIRDIYKELIELPIDAIGLDFLEGKKSLELLQKYGFASDKILFAGVINGKNIWKNNYKNTIELLKEISKYTEDIVINTSCSLLHVPYTLKNEKHLDAEYKKHFAFAEEKLEELSDLKAIISSSDPISHIKYKENIDIFKSVRITPNVDVQSKLKKLTDKDFTRLPVFAEREKIQKEEFKFPLLPTTTIGSFPQTDDVRINRAAFRKGELTETAYKNFNKEKIAECIALQENIGLDVLVHGEFERNDMVEYFGECLDGFLFTEKAWVISYGTRGVKPPIIWGDISRLKPITVEYSVYAQSITKQTVKGMLTGPITILNWSFPREDIPFKESSLQIAFAIREEVLDLEANGIRIIQIDEPALREKLPLRKTDWHSEYLDWAVPTFRLVHSGVKPKTQIHTHMCYSEFNDIIPDIDAMDADVISFEASRSDLTIIGALQAAGFKTEVGPGVYDIHSPRVPSITEIKTALSKMLEKLPKEKLWVNPDCGLKTRDNKETIPSLENLVKAAKNIRDNL
ncbi:MAG: 5-methyltetrahydropteroyltriglutamate--homocysteine S-methyltransferase [Fusobacteriaceae bacterium]|jgi:5-methyltetrahydropteroyltriglutamate--homocysteine methyltransferase|nr:5-methyltetrahydropteroyltriglutamate--homocysteine S-methyltransferase [Fusobacteriaceae bacterium]